MSAIRIGPEEFQGIYTRENGIVFEKKPERPWQYMATGTGRTGIAVMACDPVVLQINHEGAFDERGYLNAVARIHIVMDGRPLTVAQRNRRFSMVHDLQKSTITINGDDVDIRVRAHMELDLICVDIADRRQVKQCISVFVETPYLAHAKADKDMGAWWHENGKATVWHEINASSGMPDDVSFPDPLQDRLFGAALLVENGINYGNGWKWMPADTHTLYVAARVGVGVTPDNLFDAVRLRPDAAVFHATHEKWFAEFWSRVWFSTPVAEMNSFIASYDLYRYFSAVASGKDREFPLRFQMELLAGNLEENQWINMQINSIQTYQAYFGAMRNGDWAVLESLEKHYFKQESFYKQYAHSHRKHEGFFIPYECNPFGSATYFPTAQQCEHTVNEFGLYHMADHKWSMYSYEHGLALLWLLLDKSAAAGNQAEFVPRALPYINGLIVFFLEEYRVGSNGKIVFDPATSGETWYNCKNPTSWIALFKVFLPRLIRLSDTYGFVFLSENCRKLLQHLPEIAVGKWWLDEDEMAHQVDCCEDEAVMLPAEDFSRHPPINQENPELYSLWPYGLHGIGLNNYELALRTYRNMKWKRMEYGWPLDCIWAARLGVVEDAVAFADWQFPTIFRCPGGFSYEEAPKNPENPRLPLTPSMQGMGNSVCALFEMICHDNGDELQLLPAWPPEFPLSVAFYTASAGRVEIEYQPGKTPIVRTEREVRIGIYLRNWKKASDAI